MDISCTSTPTLCLLLEIGFAAAHQCGDDARCWIAKGGVERRPDPRIDSAFHLEK